MKIKIVILSILFLLSSILISGCSTLGPIYTDLQLTRPNTGILYIYRKDISALSNISPGLYLDHKEYAILPNGGYMAFELDPGSHNIELKLSNRFEGYARIDVDIISNESTYVIINPDVRTSRDSYMFSFELKKENPDIAKKFIKACKLQDPNGEKFTKGYFFQN